MSGDLEHLPKWKLMVITAIFLFALVAFRVVEIGREISEEWDRRSGKEVKL